MRCLACFETVPEGTQNCPRCGFIQYQVIGDTAEAASALEEMALRHRNRFLQRYDLGVTVYTWQERDGSVRLDTARRRSFGTADALWGKTVWLDEPFARIPERELTVELSVENGGTARVIPVRVPVPQEPQLQQLGIAMNQDLTVSLLIRNSQTQTQSQPVSFLPPR